jgi:serine/threonine protein phosphatase 1
LLELKHTCSPIFLRGNHEVMILDAREDPPKAKLWRSCGGFATLWSYGAELEDDWAPAIPDSHWKFLEGTMRFFETTDAIFVHACLDPELELIEQPDGLLFWETFEQMKPHKSGKRVICGHTHQRFGEIGDVGFAACIDTGAAVGGWLTCLDVNSGHYWQANEKGAAREGTLARKP